MYESNLDIKEFDACHEEHREKKNVVKRWVYTLQREIFCKISVSKTFTKTIINLYWNVIATWIMHWQKYHYNLSSAYEQVCKEPIYKAQRGTNIQDNGWCCAYKRHFFYVQDHHRGYMYTPASSKTYANWNTSLYFLSKVIT